MTQTWTKQDLGCRLLARRTITMQAGSRIAHFEGVGLIVLGIPLFST
jgi:hypothetical protein